jgi:hypothetical protein
MQCPEWVIVDEAHTCIAPTNASSSSQAHLRYTLLRKIAGRPEPAPAATHRHPQRRRGAWQSLIGLLDNRLGELPADMSGRDRKGDRKTPGLVHDSAQRADIREYLHEDTPFPTRETAETSFKLTPATAPCSTTSWPSRGNRSPTPP